MRRTSPPPATPNGPPLRQGPDRPGGTSGRWAWALVLVPVACCALPSLVAAGAFAGAGAAIGGGLGAALLLTAAITVVVVLRRRRRTDCARPPAEIRPAPHGDD